MNFTVQRTTLEYDLVRDNYRKVTTDNKVVTQELCEFYANKGRYYNVDGELRRDADQKRGRCRHCHGRGILAFNKGDETWTQACYCVQRNMSRYSALDVDSIVLGDFK